MPHMKFSNVAKGQLTQSIAKMLFERAGYRVTRLGIEELFHEVVQLEVQEYRKLGLPKALRALPDLLVATPNISSARLVEVKFRSRFDGDSAQALHKTLSHQFEYWPETVCMLMIAEPEDGGRFHQDFIRTIDKRTLRHLDAAKWSQPGSVRDSVQYSVANRFKVGGAMGIWGLLRPLNQAFEYFRHDKTDTWMCADMLTQTLSELKKLQE